jgi:hypothetical protein
MAMDAQDWGTQRAIEQRVIEDGDVMISASATLGSAWPRWWLQ